MATVKKKNKKERRRKKTETSKQRYTKAAKERACQIEKIKQNAEAYVELGKKYLEENV